MLMIWGLTYRPSSPARRFPTRPSGARSQTWTRRRCCGKGPSSHEFLPSRFDSQVETLKRAGSKKQEIARFRIDHLIDGEKLVEPDNCKAHTAGYLLAVCEDKSHVLFLSLNSDPFERSLRNPRVFTSCIHQEFGYDRGPSPVNRILNFALRVKRSHALKTSDW